MDTNNIKYVIFDYSEVNKINFDDVLETSIETLRTNNDITKTFVKWVGDVPQFVQSLETKSPIYDNKQMIEILSGSDWNYIPVSGSTEN